MKKILTLLAIAICSAVWAQAPAVKDTAKVDTFKHWSKNFMFGINFGAANFSDNWQGGGVSNYSLGSLLNAGANFKTRDSVFRWENTLNLQYGIQRNKGQSMRKSADLIFIDSKATYTFHKAWSAFFGVTYLTQFAPGYEYGTDGTGAETRKKISSFMSPGYLTEAMGIEYKPAPFFSARLGLGATRQTFVLNQALYNAVDTVRNGVKAGERVRNELGFQVLIDFNKDVFKNINLKARYIGFANYSDLSLNKIDHRFDVILTAKVNRFINVNFATIFLYDFDQVQAWQHSEVFALGIAFKLK